MATTAPPPPPGDGMVAIDLNIGIFGWTRGMLYRMQDPALFRLALRQRNHRRSEEHNQKLQLDGDTEARRMCRQQWRTTGDSNGDFALMYEGRAANKTFLAYVADGQGLSRLIQRAARIMEGVLRGFGIYYPVSNAEEAEIDRVWDLARRALSERVAAESEAKRLEKWWEEYRQWCWAWYYYAQGGR